jgi:hypothetical protein
MIDAQATTTQPSFLRRFELWLPAVIVLLDQVSKAIV